MEDTFRTFASYVGLMLEGLTVLMVAIGAIEAVYRLVAGAILRRSTTFDRRAIWLRFAVWILLALEFALGADIVRSAVAPTWQDIGKLGVIALIRTGLGFFLSKDLDSVSEQEAEKTAKPGTTSP